MSQIPNIQSLIPNTPSPTRPILRYHGGKWRLAPWIIQHLPPHRTYVEPYGGAASVLLRKPRAYAEIYNDLDHEIVNLFRVLRNPDQAHALLVYLKLTPYARDEHALSYLPAGDPVEQARRTIVRSFMNYGSTMTGQWTSGFRSDTKRTGSTGAADWRKLPAALPAAIERLRGVIIENRPALQVIADHDDPQTLYYIDPPYPHSTRNQRWAGNAYRHELTDDDHRALAAALHQVQGMVIISGYPCPLYDDQLYPTWQRVTRDALADGAQQRTEALWLSPNTTSARIQLLNPHQEQTS